MYECMINRICMYVCMYVCSVVLYCFLRNIVTTEIEYAGTLTSLHFVTIPIENGSSSKSYNGYAPMSSENELV